MEMTFDQDIVPKQETDVKNSAIKSLEDAIDFNSTTPSSIMNLTKDTKDLSTNESNLEAKMM